MAISPLAGKPAPDELLIDVPTLRDQYYRIHPDPSDPAHPPARHSRLRASDLRLQLGVERGAEWRTCRNREPRHRRHHCGGGEGAGSVSG